MAHIDPNISTGIQNLDRVLRGLMPGDNLVWNVDTVKDYLPFVEAACDGASKRKQQVVYFHFATHAPLMDEQDGVVIYNLNPQMGFDSFIQEIHNVINDRRHKALYIFDSLSELAADWCSDRMLGNFFMLTCPLLYDVGAIAYFALLRNKHSFHAVQPISDTAQILIDIYRRDGRLYVHPCKVQHRHSPTMYMPHVWKGDQFIPVTQSLTVTGILKDVPWNRSEIANHHLGYWSKAFVRAEKVHESLERGEAPPEDLEEFTEHMRRMMISQDERILSVVRKYFYLDEIVKIRRRMIGTGRVGGKSVGMLLSRAILEKESPRWREILEPHDSFFIGSDVFCTYLVQNGCWWAKQAQHSEKDFMKGSMRARQSLLTGSFPSYLVKQFAAMLDYFGQSPIIVRSSSLLEDAFGSAFAGKHESVFCANQGSPEKRMADFLSAVRTVYSSIMSENALKYRAVRGLLDQDEQMALLVQRVSGSSCGRRFYPQSAGVALSFNPYVWSEYIEASAGVVRIVFGLGTRAVDRFDDDYTRVVALNAPERRPETDSNSVREYAQHKVDYLDMEANQEVTCDFEEIATESENLPLNMFASHDRSVERYASEHNIKNVFSLVPTFENLLKDTPFVDDMREMLGTLQRVYKYPVEVEYTLNFFDEEEYKINIVQCRPLQVKGGGVITAPPDDISEEDLVLRTHGPVIGQGRVSNIERVIYVVPSFYSKLTTYDCYAVARVIGRLMHLDGDKDLVTMLMGPGRWGTTTPSLGVPVNFTEINTVDVICEIVAMRDDLVPDVSLGTHFFNELVEMDVLYFAHFPDKEANVLEEGFIRRQPNRLAELLPGEEAWSEVIRVVDFSNGENQTLVLNADTVKQRVVCYMDKG